MPIIFTNQFETKEVLSSDIGYEKFDYGNYSIIKLLHIEDGSVEEWQFYMCKMIVLNYRKNFLS